MQSLTQRIIQGLSVVGLAACVSCTDADKNKRIAKIVDVSASVNYEEVHWDNAYVTAITCGGDSENENVVVIRLAFESYLKGEPGTRITKALTHDEINKLNIGTVRELIDFLEQESQHHSGYVGPNLMF